MKQGRGSLIDTKYFRHAQNFKSYLRRNAYSKNRAEHEHNWNFSPLQFCLVFLQCSSEYIFTSRALSVRQCPESSSRKPSEQLRYSCYKVPPIRWLTCSIISSRRFYKRKKQNIIPFQEVQSNRSYGEHPRDLYKSPLKTGSSILKSLRDLESGSNSILVNNGKLWNTSCYFRDNVKYMRQSEVYRSWRHTTSNKNKSSVNTKPNKIKYCISALMTAQFVGKLKWPIY